MSERTCREAGCAREHVARDLCALHYRRWREREKAQPCKVDGCGNVAHVSGLCRGHYARQQRGQPVEGPLMRYDRGTQVVVVRMRKAAVEVLKHRASVSGTTVNKLAAQLLEAAASADGSPA